MRTSCGPLAVSVLLGMCMAPLAAAPARPKAGEAVALAQRYLAAWATDLAAVVAEEDYTQEVRTYRRSSRFASWVTADTRRLRSDVLLLRAPAEDVWLSFRDVIMVDGEPVRDRERRFDALFVKPDAALAATARRIADESARYNIGRVARNSNTPTTTLVFLTGAYAQSTSWSLDHDGRLDHSPAWILTFSQRKAPYAVRRFDGRPQRASGRIWLEPGTGRILRTELAIREPSLRSDTIVTYGQVPSMTPWVPVRMVDEYEIPGMEQMHGTATYSNHRLFQTAARIVGGAG